MTDVKEQGICKVCSLPLRFVPHYEFDGTEYGSYEPYWECPEGHKYPESEYPELTPQELAERQQKRVNFPNELSLLVDSTILELNPSLDDDIAEVLEDWDNRVEAIDYLIEKLQKMKAE